MDNADGLDCILLAAGASSRMGMPKLFLPFRGTTVLGAAVDTVLRAGLRAIIVARPDDEALREAFLGRDGVELVVNPRPERGMVSSFQAGARRVRSGRFFFQPADMPFLPLGIYGRLAAISAAGPIIPLAGGRKGHPVLMPSSMLPDILGLPDSMPLNALILASGPTYTETGEAAILRDIDTRLDYREAMAETAVGIRPVQLPL